MANNQVRSPRYPILGLGQILERVRSVYEADHRNRIPKEIVARHIGYNSLNGKSLGVISAMLKYGLLEGGSDRMWISDRAVLILEHAPGQPERIQAIQEAASEPELFAELNAAFSGKASDAALRSFLITKRKFIPRSADKAIRAYRETQEVVEREVQGYREESPEDDTLMPPSEQFMPGQRAGDPGSSRGSFSGSALPEGSRREVITLDEGDVVITFPETLSSVSVADLKDHLELFIRKAERRAGTEVAKDDATALGSPKD